MNMPKKFKETTLAFIQSRITQLVAIIAACVTIGTYVLNFQIERVKDQMAKQCAMEKSKMEQAYQIVGAYKLSDIIDELCYLRHFADYSIMTGLYHQNKSEDRKIRMIHKTKVLAEFVRKRNKQITQKVDGNDEVEAVLFSSDEIRFNTGQSYMIPEIVRILIEDPDFYESQKTYSSKIEKMNNIHKESAVMMRLK